MGRRRVTTVRRRGGVISRYRVVRTFDVEGDRHMWSVVDNQTRQWARGTSADGYDTEEAAAEICEALRAKEKV